MKVIELPNPADLLFAEMLCLYTEGESRLEIEACMTVS